MRRVFISYRRADSAGQAGRIFDRLAAHFGRHRVFMDVEAIQPGADFVSALEEGVGAAAAVLAIIGPRWLSAADADGLRRLDDPHDHVRQEIAAGLGREHVRTIPVLVDGAGMPKAEDIPAALRPLSRREAMRIGSASFDTDVARLIELLEDVVGPVAPDRSLGEPLREVELQVVLDVGRQVALSADGRRFAVIAHPKMNPYDYGTVRVWELSTGQVVTEFSGESQRARPLALSPDGGLAAIGSQLSGVVLWELPTGRQLGELVHLPVVRQAFNILGGLAVSAMAFSSDGRFLATAFGFNAYVWDVMQRRRLTSVGAGRRWRLSDVALDREGTRLATASRGETRVWELPDGRPLERFPHGRRLAFSADGTRLATAGPDERAQVWDFVHKRAVACVRHDAKVAAVALSRNGTYLTTGAEDRTLCLWDVADGRELLRHALDGPVKYVAITTDGRHVAAATPSCLKVWSTSAVLDQEPGPVQA